MQQYRSKASSSSFSSVIASPYHETVANNHVSDTITGERKVMEMCYIHTF
jgi:hypothetical protein